MVTRRSSAAARSTRSTPSWAETGDQPGTTKVIETLTRAEALLRTATKSVLAVDLVIGLLLLLAGMGDPGPGVSTPFAVQMLPLSGFVVMGAGLFGMRALSPTRLARSEGAKLVVVALVLVAVAVWISVVRVQAQGIGTVLVIGALAPFLAGCVAVTKHANQLSRMYQELPTVLWSVASLLVFFSSVSTGIAQMTIG